MCDFAVPGAEPPAAAGERNGFRYRSARWTPERLAGVMTELAGEGPGALAGLGRKGLLAAWEDTVAAFLEPASPERRELDPALASFCRLSRAGLEAGLEAVLGGVGSEPARRLATESTPLAHPSPALVILAGNLPGLAVQPLLPALLLGRPVLLKSPSAEPLFAPAFARALAGRTPELARAVAAVTWPGGRRELETPVLSGAGVVVAYGETETLADLESRTPGRLVGYGPRTSLAVVGAGVDPGSVAPGLARDVALFDQRGCLSVTAVFTAGDAVDLARELARALAAEAERLPPGPADPQAAAAVQQIRGVAEMQGLTLFALELSAGTVVVEQRPELRPSPGLRTVRVHPMPDLARLPEILLPWRDRLQGAALAGDEALALAPHLEALGISRCAPPGELQSPDATWHNGGVHPLAALAG